MAVKGSLILIFFLNDHQDTSYFFVADDTLRPHLMEPYSPWDMTRAKHIFNYRLSRERRIVENPVPSSPYHYATGKTEWYSAPLPSSNNHTEEYTIIELYYCKENKILCCHIMTTIKIKIFVTRERGGASCHK